MVEIQEAQLKQSNLCEPILHSLPEWFGIEEAITHYLQSIDKLPTFIAWEADQAVGFLTVKQHNNYAAEVYVMAVHPQFHRQGIGRLLMNRAEEMLKKLGVEYLQVKTLGTSHPDVNYAHTRTFYFAVGFRPLEESMKLWEREGIPCLQMVKRL